MAPRRALAYTPHMHQRYLPLLLTCLPLTTALIPAHAESIYRWVDAAGVVHYSQTAPGGHAYQRVNPQVPPPTSAPGVSGIQQFSKNYSSEQAAQDKAREAALKSKAQNAEQCAKARQQISRLQTATAHRLFVTGADGQRRRMTQPEFEKLLNHAQTRANATCVN